MRIAFLTMVADMIPRLAITASARLTAAESLIVDIFGLALSYAVGTCLCACMIKFPARPVAQQAVPVDQSATLSYQTPGGPQGAIGLRKGALVPLLSFVMHTATT